MTSRNGEYLQEQLFSLGGWGQPRDGASWSSVGVSLDMGRLLEKGCV